MSSRGDLVMVTEPNKREWLGTIIQMNPTPKEKLVTVLDEDGFGWVIPEEQVRAALCATCGQLAAAHGRVTHFFKESEATA